MVTLNSKIRPPLPDFPGFILTIRFRGTKFSVPYKLWQKITLKRGMKYQVTHNPFSRLLSRRKYHTIKRRVHDIQGQLSQPSVRRRLAVSIETIQENKLRKTIYGFILVQNIAVINYVTRYVRCHGPELHSMFTSTKKAIYLWSKVALWTMWYKARIACHTSANSLIPARTHNHLRSPIIAHLSWVVANEVARAYRDPDLSEMILPVLRLSWVSNRVRHDN